MNRYLLFIALVAGFLSAISQKAAFGDVSADGQNSDLSLTITKFQVNDQTLELGWKIVNNTDHDVWICDNYVDKFMDRDNETLVIRMRYNISNAGMLWEIPYPRFRYSRLGPGQEKVKSLSLALPVEPRATFKTSRGNAEHARRVALEIGYYDEDLRALILEIANVRDKLGCDWSAISFAEVPQSTWEVYNRFFGGVRIARLFDSPTVEYFHDSVMSDGDEIIAPYFNQALYGEQVLRLEVDNVSIPYKSNYPPLTDEPPQSETEPAGVTTVFTKFDVNDTKLKMDYKIINNTDHDIWLCDKYVDKFMEIDNRTLVLRTRYNLSNEGIIWEFPFPRFRYSRLRPDNEKIESISLDFPVKPDALFKTSRGNAESAQRLAVEIGYYDEDLRKLILDIVEIAEKLNCDGSAISPWEPNSTLEIYYRFFGGVEIAGFFNSEGSSYFRDSVMSDDDEIIAPYLKQTLNGEKVLRIEVDNVSIPYESNYPPLND